MPSRRIARFQAIAAWKHRYSTVLRDLPGTRFVAHRIDDRLIGTALFFDIRCGLAINEKEFGTQQADAIGAVFKCALEGEGGGNFIVNLKDNPGVTEGDGAAECTIRMTSQDFVDLTEDKANGQQLFFTGKLKVEGDMSLALRLQPLMDILK